MRSVTASDGRTLTVREGGAPEGFPVLAISGTPGSSTLYEPHVRDAAERGIRLFSYDRPGYGGSTRLKGRKVADCAADIVTVCDALAIDRFCVWGISGGGPHALAAAALLPDRVVAAAVLASVAPYDAEGLDFIDGMGEQNVEEFGTIFEGEDAHRASMEKQRNELLSATPEQLVELWQTLLGPSDRQVATGELAAFLLDHIRAGIAPGGDGWIDDDLAFVTPWGFDLASIRVPVQLWQGEQDRFVPYGHGVWLAEHIPGVDARLSAEDGHLTLAERRVPETHRWLLEHAALGANAHGVVSPADERWGRAEAVMHDRNQIEKLARTYTEAWCSHDAGRVADHYVPGGMIAINGGEPAGIAEVARSFVAAFPDIEVFMDELVIKEDSVEYHWTFTGTSADTGKRVRIAGFEEWTIGADGLIVESLGHYDQAEYDRQLQHGVGAAR